MSAGLLTYRLCDRDFDCEHCLLDLALRGDRAAPPVPAFPGEALPADRLYGPRHTWLQPVPGTDSWRAGIDAFAAGLLDDESRLQPALPGDLLRGDPLLQVRIRNGVVVIAAPVSGRLLRINHALLRDSRLLLEDPCGAGWIAELLPDPAGLHDLDTADRADARLAADRARFRRAAAVALLGRPLTASPCRGFGRSTDLRHLVDGPAWLDLLAEVLH